MKNLFDAILISLLVIGCQSGSVKKSKILDFELMEKQDISFAGIPKMVNRIILNVNSIPTEQEMRSTANYIWENGNKKWKEFTVFMYMPGMNTKSTAYGIAEFNENGLKDFIKSDFVLNGTQWEIKKIEKPLKEIPITKLKEYKIKISAINLGERKVRINITTNFPDGTNLFLSSFRIYHTKGDTVAHCGDLPEKVFSVKDGKFETIIIIDDTEWYNIYKGVSKIFPTDFPPISKISNKITINVMYTAARDQPANVTEILGTHGEFVTGKGSEQFGTGTAGKLTFLSVTMEFNIPFEK